MSKVIWVATCILGKSVANQFCIFISWTILVLIGESVYPIIKEIPGLNSGTMHSFTYAVTMYIVWVLVYLNLSIHIPTLYPRGLNYNNNYMEAFFHNFEIMFILSSEISVFIIICSSRFHNVQKWFSHEFLFHDFFLLIWKWKITMFRWSRLSGLSI